MRQVVLDTETTGLEVGKGHRIIEIGCIEIIERRFTDKHLHHYLNPEYEIDAGALAVHGLTKEFLSDKPKFAEIIDELLQFVAGAELIIHNAPFDVAFLHNELKLVGDHYGCIADHGSVLDTLVMARERYPGQKNSLDALCKRLNVDNSQRNFHGALLDARLLAEVYLRMTAGQAELGLIAESGAARSNEERSIQADLSRLRVVYANEHELGAHETRLRAIANAAKQGCLWLEN